MSYPRNIIPNYWLNIINTNNKKIKIKKTLTNLQNKNIIARQIWHPVHKLLPYQKSECYNIVKANKLYETCFCLPSSANLKLTEIKKICNLLK